jgi:hypothetical protein
MAELTVQQIDRDGLEPSLASAASGGDTFDNDGRTFLWVKDTGTTAPTVTIAIQKTVDGQSVTGRTVAVESGEERLIGPFPPTEYNNSDDEVEISYDDETDVTVAAVRL